ncbi:hypothetical protein MTR67_042739 [Solanum verrucosum]|uniref:Uncharacterized protein n=1 Tax=Solanum verrucosum TaxID=315347 RepID=A0AAF0ZUG0_SOLVR|nr:hypothetical protein MTR67_042739 [Solanum verrucosum]
MSEHRPIRIAKCNLLNNLYLISATLIFMKTLL